ncbi:hypothetical protein L1887_16477 [Cichorium endivia]|nr:hypothetical protein L1887_16477 [Cichorium endivia]
MHDSYAVDAIHANELLKDGNTIISDGEMFELGETPLTDNSGEFKVRSSGGPVIHSGGNTMIWSSNYTVAVTNLDPVAQLLDTGNLVVWDKNQNMIWQSFDYPGDTLLPGMKIGKDLVTGMDRYLSSWRTPNDPFPVALHWIERMHDWIHYGNAEQDVCSVYGLCGPYGSCSINRYPPCTCMDGFVPTFQEEWNQADWSGGCKLKTPLSCVSGDGFKRLKGLKFPDTQWSRYNENMTLGECETACKMDCNCTAYANLDIRNGGSGCLLWFGELIDIREYDEDQYIYVKMAASELAGFLNLSTDKKKRAFTMILCVSLGMLLLSAVAYAFAWKKKRPHMKKRGTRKHDSDFSAEDLDELPFFSLNSIAKATNGFSINNKIGEGGFGPVYKILCIKSKKTP